MVRDIRDVRVARSWLGAERRLSAIVLPDPMQHVVNGIRLAPVVDQIDDEGREGANDKGDGGDVDGAQALHCPVEQVRRRPTANLRTAGEWGSFAAGRPLAGGVGSMSGIRRVASGGVVRTPRMPPKPIRTARRKPSDFMIVRCIASASAFGLRGTCLRSPRNQSLVLLRARGNLLIGIFTVDTILLLGIHDRGVNAVEQLGSMRNGRSAPRRPIDRIGAATNSDTTRGGPERRVPPEAVLAALALDVIRSYTSRSMYTS